MFIVCGYAQGTGCVTLAGVLSAARQTGKGIRDLRILCAGAGSAGLGVCGAILDGMVRAGLTREEAKSRFVVCNVNGALGRRVADGSGFGNPNYEQGLTVDPTFSQWLSDEVADGTSLLKVVQDFKPTVLLGLSAQPNVFTEDIVRLGHWLLFVFVIDVCLSGRWPRSASGR